MPKSNKWECEFCHGHNVQISLPVWHREDTDGELTQLGTDSEACPLYWYCEDCDESGNGEPLLNGNEVQS